MVPEGPKSHHRQGNVQNLGSKALQPAPPGARHPGTRPRVPCRPGDPRDPALAGPGHPADPRGHAGGRHCRPPVGRTEHARLPGCWSPRGPGLRRRRIRCGHPSRPHGRLPVGIPRGCLVRWSGPPALSGSLEPGRGDHCWTHGHHGPRLPGAPGLRARAGGYLEARAAAGSWMHREVRYGPAPPGAGRIPGHPPFPFTVESGASKLRPSPDSQPRTAGRTTERTHCTSHDRHH